jgi:hypothetical protein
MGPFPAWAHNLTKLALLNLGQNDISGEIPLIIGEFRNDGGFPLTNLGDFILQICATEASILYGDNSGAGRINFIRKFLRKQLLLTTPRHSFWIDSRGQITRNFLLLKNLEEIIEEYFKAENYYSLNKIYHNVRKKDPVRAVKLLWGN